MILPIIEPEMTFLQERYELPKEEWQDSLSKLTEFEITVEIQAKQYLEDCLEQRTDLIAIQGNLCVDGESLPFSAQLDVQGYGLYVDGQGANSKSFERVKNILGKIYGKSA